MLLYLFPFLSAFLFVYLLIPFVNHFAHQYQIIDKPSARKKHKGIIPLTGGPAIFMGMVPLVFLFLGWNKLTLTYLVGSLLILLTGIIDDWYKGHDQELSPWPKLLTQFLAATVLYMSGTKIIGVGAWFNQDAFIFFPAWLSYIVSILWVVGMMNMINFIDGMDGLAGGVSVIVTLTLFFIAFLKDQSEIALLAMLITGAVMAFLRHNFHPASIFLGDSGSMLLGFTIAFLSIEGAMKSATLLTMGVILLALGIPVFDTLQVIITRIKEGRPVYQADRSHLHHRLLSMGFTQKQVVILLYVIGIGFSLTSLLIFFFFE